MRAVDTDVVVRYLTNDDPAQAVRARRLLDRKEVFVSLTVLLETAWVLRGVFGLARADVLRALRAFAGLPRVTLESPGVAAKVLRSIADINVNMISQGASEINISVVIDEEHVDEVVRRLHKEFFSDVKHLTEIFE